jgi:hypothetical protein
MPDPSDLLPASHAEITSVLTEAIRASAGGAMTRLGETFLAGLAAEHLAERLALAGYIVMRRPDAGLAPLQGGLWES